MPLKVRCRCGQELVLRYSEWVYFVVGFLVLSLLVNVVVLVLIYDQLRTVGERAAVAPATAPVTPSHPVPGGGDDGAVPPQALLAQENTEVGRAAPVTPPHRATDHPADGSSARPLSQIKPSLSLPRPEETNGVPPSVGGDAPLPRAADLAESEKLARAVSSPDPLTPDTVTPNTVTPDAANPNTVNSQRFRALGKEFPPVLRYAMAEALQDADTPDAVRVWSALLLDPEERVRNRARILLSSRMSGAGAANDTVERDRALRDFVAGWVQYGEAWIGTTERGRELVERFGSADGDVDDGASDDGDLDEERVNDKDGRRNPGDGSGRTDRVDIDDLPWDAVRRRARTFVASVDELRFLRDVLDQCAANGTDVLLVVDVTESMSDSLAVIRRVARWLLPLVVWSGRRCRVAGLLYRDDVAATVDFDSDATKLIAAIEKEHASGGGADVPEGVFEALRGALQLGRFSWRFGADKVVIVVGDAPPPYAKKEALLTLAEQAHREAGFSINALSVSDWEGWDGVPFFPQLAERGGGRAITATETQIAGGAPSDNDIASAIFELSLPFVDAKTTAAGGAPKSAKLVESVLLRVRRAFGG